MKVRELIEALKEFNPELEVQTFHDMGAVGIYGPTLYYGEYEDVDNCKAIRVTIRGRFVGIGNPADFDIWENDTPEIDNE